jgi:hypothetical protein
MTQPQQALAITEKNLTEAFEHARKLMNSKDANEVMQLQTEFLRNQFGIATEQSTQMDSGMLPLGTLSAWSTLFTAKSRTCGRTSNVILGSDMSLSPSGHKRECTRLRAVRPSAQGNDLINE